MDVLQVTGLTKKFGSFTAVDTISFSLKEGEILGLLGRNGAGKTTTIQMLLGVLTPNSGSIHYFGKDLQKHRETVLEKVNFSSTYTNLPWDLTVSENLTYISYLYSIQNRKERVGKIAHIFRLEDVLNKQVRDLSAGQITRVNLAKALLNYPKVLLLDEPTASLDPDVAKYIREFLLDQRKQFNVSIILTSHNMAEVEDVCDRVVFIEGGKIVADDTPDQLAKTIKISHVELMVKDGLKRTIEYCSSKEISYRVKGRFIVVDIEEQIIPDFLRGLMDIGVYYDEIAIEKPTLEDYFLQVTHKS
jgi:ABC-2 type transport system ATP-binding protein